MTPLSIQELFIFLNWATVDFLNKNHNGNPKKIIKIKSTIKKANRLNIFVLSIVIGTITITCRLLNTKII
jgi:hypothetical protein